MGVAICRTCGRNSSPRTRLLRYCDDCREISIGGFGAELNTTEPQNNTPGDGRASEQQIEGGGQPIEQPVYFSWTRPQFGGRRPWFLCPLCIRRVALLYLRGERWACRVCCDLAYRSELESKGYRGQMKARKIRMRLGGNRSGIEFPDKPRGMHWRRYERWREKHDAAVAKSWSGFWGSRFAAAARSRLACVAPAWSRAADPRPRATAEMPRLRTTPQCVSRLSGVVAGEPVGMANVELPGDFFAQRRPNGP